MPISKIIVPITGRLDATEALVPMLVSSSRSWNSPVRPAAAEPRNQSQVKPRQGGAG